MHQVKKNAGILYKYTDDYIGLLLSDLWEVSDRQPTKSKEADMENCFIDAGFEVPGKKLMYLF